MEKFARKCSVTGKGINEGFCFFDGGMYFEHEKDALEYAKTLGYETLKKSYKAGVHYWTDWYDTIDEENDDYYDEEGNKYNCKGELICAKEN